MENPFWEADSQADTIDIYRSLMGPKVSLQQQQLCGLSPRVNYVAWATASCRQS
jgi:hypothetical protein